MRIPALAALALFALGGCVDRLDPAASAELAILPDEDGGVDASPGPGAGPGKNRGGSNSQIVMPRNLMFADLNGDGMADVLQWSANKVFVSGSGFAAHAGYFHLYLPSAIKRIVTGDFRGVGYDQACVFWGDVVDCYEPSDDGQRLELWFRQPSWLVSGDNTVVADFDGDLRDDLLVTSSAGLQRLYSATGSFASRPDVDLRAMSTFAPTLKQVRAGDFNGDGMADLLLYAPDGAARLFASRIVNEHNTFVSLGLAGTGLFTSFDDVAAAHINDGPSDEVVAHNVTTGATRVYRLAFVGGALELINVDIGPAARGNTRLYWARVRIDDNDAAERDDQIIYDLSTDHLQLAQAVWRANPPLETPSYELVHDDPAPQNHAGWPAVAPKPILVLKCKFSDVDDVPRSDGDYEKLMLGPGGVGDFWSESTYGTWPFTGTRMVPGWRPMNITRAAFEALPTRAEKIQKCRDTYTEPTTGLVSPVHFVNAQGGDGGADASGRVLAPGLSSVTFLSHETGHGLGFGHSWDDTPTEYGDRWDIMSAMRVIMYTGIFGLHSGPELNATLRAKRGFIPEHRLRRLAVGTDEAIQLAAVTRPEAEGALVVRVGASDSDYLTIEYRIPDGFDRGLTRGGILLHHMVNGRPMLILGSPTDRQPGSQTVTSIPGARITVDVDSFSGFTARVRVKVDPA